MNLGVVANSEGLKYELNEVNSILQGIISGMDEDSILVVSGNKAFDITNKASSKSKNTHERDDLITTVMSETKHEKYMPKTGLFMFTKKKSVYNTDYKDIKDLRSICPLKDQLNQVKTSLKPIFAKNEDKKDNESEEKEVGQMVDEEGDEIGDQEDPKNKNEQAVKYEHKTDRDLMFLDTFKSKYHQLTQ
jgi:hypothetical protein